MHAPTRTVAYLRVSTEKQAADGVSLEAQRRKVELYAELHGLDLVAVVEDAGVSAKTLDRPGLSRALGMLRAGEADALLVVKLDRLTRSVKDLGTLLDRYFGKDAGPALMVVAEQVDTRSAAGRLVLNVLMSVAQWEREAIGERTASAMRHMAENGEYTGGHAPYGWALAGDGSLVVNDAEQEAIAVAHELRAAGLSLRKVGAMLASRGLAPRSGKWHPQKVKNLLAARVAA